jgi:hypothetical protein
MKPTLIALVLLFAACKGHQGAVKPAETELNTGAEKPAWVRSRPSSDADYIGIGLCPIIRKVRRKPR